MVWMCPCGSLCFEKGRREVAETPQIAVSEGRTNINSNAIEHKREVNVLYITAALLGNARNPPSAEQP